MKDNKVRSYDEGMNLLSIFGKEYSDDAWCWVRGNVLWLSMIIVKDEHRGKGKLDDLLDMVKKDFDKVIIPSPFAVVELAAFRHGWVKEDVIEHDEIVPSMVWRRKA